MAEGGGGSALVQGLPIWADIILSGMKSLVSCSVHSRFAKRMPCLNLACSAMALRLFSSVQFVEARVHVIA